MSCDNDRMIVCGRHLPLLQRIMLAASVVIALVGMHHLTSLGCMEPVAHHGVVQEFEAGLSSGLSPENSTTDSPDNGVTAGLVCLALLIAVGVVFRAAGGVLTRRRSVHAVGFDTAGPSRGGKPPDLYALSISRT